MDNRWDILKQMIEYYLSDKNYLTKREIHYIVKFSENANKNTILINKN